MKKVLMMMALICAVGSAKAQFSLSDITKAVTDQVSQATGVSSTTLSAANLVGTWKYSAPAVILESDNTLAQIGGKAAASAAQSKLAKELQKIGIKSGVVTFVFSSDSTFTASSTASKKKVSGSWSCTEKQITFKIAKIAPVKVNAQLNSGNLQMVANTTLLLKLASNAGTKVSNSTIKTISNLATSFDGMQLGLEFTK